MDEIKHTALAQGLKWSYKDHQFTGYSIAGITTSLVYNNNGLVFDLGQGLPFNIPHKHYFLTHVHSDHAAGLPYILSQRSLMSLPPAEVYVHPEYIEGLTNILEQWQKLEGYTYKYNLNPISVGQKVWVDKNLYVEPLTAHHRITAQGYRAVRVKKRLKPEFYKCSPEELVELRKQNRDIDEKTEEGLFAFTGDTTIEFLDTFTKHTHVLFIETTFIDALKDVNSARTWGHIHFDEVLERLEQIPADKVCLIHLSARYNTSTANRILDEKIPSHLRAKVELFPRPF